MFRRSGSRSPPRTCATQSSYGALAFLPAGGGARIGASPKASGVHPEPQPHARKLPGKIAPVLASFAAVLLTTIVLLAIHSRLQAQNLILGYLLPTIVIAIYFGSTLAVLSSFVSSLSAAYFLFPPIFSFYIDSPRHVAELGFFMLLAIIGSKVIAILTETRSVRTSSPGHRAGGRRPG